MNVFSAIVFICLGWLFLVSVSAFLELWRLLTAIGRSKAFVDMVLEKGETKDGSLFDAIRMAEEHLGVESLTKSLWAGLARRERNVAGLLDRVEDEAIVPGAMRGGTIVQIAPAVGLLWTAASISIGLYSARHAPAEAAAGLVGVLPIALMSTVFCLMLAIGLRAQLGATLRAWQGLRARSLRLSALPLTPRHQHHKPAHPREVY